MYRPVKIIARLMLVVFVSTCIVGQCSGAETVEVRMFVLNSDAGLPVVNPRANEVFKITMMAYYENELIKGLKIISDDFKINESYVEDTLNPNVWHNIFLLKAPGKAGAYICKFEGVSKNGIKFVFEKEISVDNNEFNLFDARDFVTFMAVVGGISFFALLINWAGQASK